MSKSLAHDEINFKDLEEFVQVDEQNGIKIGDIYIPPPPAESSCTFEATEARLMIYQIVNTNFKSYAGTHILGPFHKNFTAIVGPNGSGKSNVIDSMLFVFGYRAKKIRSKKVSVMIHKSEKHTNLDSCSVSICFQKIIDKGRDDFEVVPNSQFKVTRTAFQDNSSYYSIDDKRMQFAQVGQLLRGHGIDLDHNRFLILQGEVEQISMMQPKAVSEHDSGMLEFIEDIVGTNRYKEPLDLLAKKVELICEQRVEKVNRVKLVEKELKELEEFKNEAMKCVELKNNIARAKNSLYQRKKLESSKHKEEAVTKRDAIAQEQETLQKNLDETKESKNVVETEFKALAKEREKFNKTYEECKEKFEAMERQDLTARETLRHAKGRLKKFNNDLEGEKSKVLEYSKLPQTLEKEVEELKELKEKMEKEKTTKQEKLTQAMASIQVETKELQQEKEQHQSQLMALSTTLNSAKSKMELCRSQLDLLEEGKRKHTARLETLKQDLAKVQETAASARQELAGLEEKLPQLQTDCAKAKKKLSTISVEEGTLSVKVKEQRIHLETNRHRLQASQGRSRVLDALMAEKRSGRLPGIFGRLGDLGSIEPKYDIAVSTACGPLDNIITDTITTAQQCVEFLKRNKVGQATFLGLDKMARWIPMMQNKITTPENVPRLFDLIHVEDQRVLPAFYFGLQDTLVADSLEQATRIAFQGRQRYRVVTLKGELIDISGTMSGGGSRPLSGRMGSKVVVGMEMSPAELDRLSTDFEGQRKRLEELQSQKSSLEESCATMEQELAQLMHRRNKLQLDTQSLATQQAALQQGLKDQEKKVKDSMPDEKEVQCKKKELEAAEKDYKKESDKAEKIEAKVKEVHDKIVAYQEKKCGKVQKEIHEIEGKIRKISEGLVRNSASLKSANRNKKKSEDKVEKITAEIQETTDKMTRIREELVKIQEDAGKIQEKKFEAEESRDKLDEQLKELSKKLRCLSEKETGLNREMVGVKNEFQKWEAQVQDLTSAVKHWAQKLSKVSLHIIEGEDMGPPLAELTPEELEQTDPKALENQISEQEGALNAMEPNMAAINEYRRKEKIQEERQKELNDVTRERDTQRTIVDRLNKKRLAEFMHGFHIIASKLKEMYQMITLGGDAELELMDSMDPFGGGVTFSVRPPKKSWKAISNLSGGEKTLSSLSLVFALHYYRPTPVYFMDEIDAALDFKNVSIVGNYIKERTENAQFIIISLRNNMFELADSLVGIYKTYNCTKSITINPAKIEAAAATRKSPKATNNDNVVTSTTA